MRKRSGFSPREFQEASIEQTFFRIAFENKEGDIPADGLVFKKVDKGATLKRTVESEAILQANWEKAKESGKIKEYPNDLLPSRYRYVDCKKEDNSLILTVDPCVSYRDFVGSRDPEFIKRFGLDFLPNPLSSGMVVITADDKIVISLRKPSNDYKAGGHQFNSGGFIKVGEDLSPLDCALRETKEEIGLSKMESVKLLGILINNWGYSTDICFLGHTSLTSEDIMSLTRDNENDLFFIPNDRLKVQQFLLNHVHACASIGGIILAGRRLFADQVDVDEWQGTMLKSLNFRGEGYDDQVIRQELEERDVARLLKKINN